MSTKLIVLTVLVAVLAYLAVESEGCGFPMPAPMCGCGGGCGGGCGRRKRREIAEYPTNQASTTPAQRVIVPADKTEEILACPQSEWRPLLIRNMEKNPAESAKAIKQALYQKYQTQFFVACIPKGARAFVSNGEGYCSVEGEDIWCSAIAILG